MHRNGNGNHSNPESSEEDRPKSILELPPEDFHLLHAAQGLAAVEQEMQERIERRGDDGEEYSDADLDRVIALSQVHALLGIGHQLREIDKSLVAGLNMMHSLLDHGIDDEGKMIHILRTTNMQAVEEEQ